MKYKLIIDKNADEEIIAIVRAPSSLTQQIEDLVSRYSGTESILGYPNRDQLLTNKSPVKENNWYNSTTSRMLIYQQPLHIYKAKNPPSSGSDNLLEKAP